MPLVRVTTLGQARGAAPRVATVLDGRRVALVGLSGAGKSTVAPVLLRFCDLCGGSAHRRRCSPGRTCPADSRSADAGYQPEAVHQVRLDDDDVVG